MPDTPARWLEEFAVTDRALDQLDPAVVQLDTGNIVVVWTDTSDVAPGDNNGSDILGQMYDPLGAPIGDVFQANSFFLVDDEGSPDLARSGFAGGFVIVYEDTDSSGTSIRAERWTTNDNGVDSSVFVVIDEDNSDTTLSGPSVASNDTGAYAVAYTETDIGGNNSAAKVVIVNSSNVASAPVTVIPNSTINFGRTDIVSTTDGNYVMASGFSFNDGTDNQIGIAISRLDTSGNLRTPAFFAGFSGSDEVFDTNASLAALTGGGVVVAWEHASAPNGGASMIKFARYDNNGATLNFEVDVNAESAVQDLDPNVVALADGGFVISYSDGVAADVKAQRFDANANEVGDEFVLHDPNDLLSSFQTDGVGLEDGRIFAVSRSPGDSSTDIFGDVFDPRDNVNDPSVYLPESFQIGTPDSDVFTVEIGADQVHGHDGADIITDTQGAADIFGGDGDDVISTATVDNAREIHGGDGIDTVVVTGSFSAVYFTDLLSAMQMTGIENITGGAGQESIFGDAGDNVLRGGGGRDDIDPDAGADSVFGDAGDDTITRGGAAMAFEDSYDGGGDTDTILIDDDSIADDSFFDLEEGFLKLAGGFNFEAWSNFENYNGGVRTGAETVFGTSGRNIFQGGSGVSIFDGREEDDTLLGFGGDDQLTGGAGDDNIDGGLGDDMLDGGAGTADIANYASANGAVTIRLDNGVATGANGSDTLAGFENAIGSDNFNDIIFGSNGANEIDGRAGNDRINGLGGADDITGGLGDDQLFGFNLNDVISGGEGTDLLRGDAGADQLDGGADNDRLFGGSGDDSLIGGEGADLLDGSGGQDFYQGDAGADRLSSRLDGVQDQFFFGVGTGADRIFRYEEDIDQIIVSNAFGFTDGQDVIDNAVTAVINSGGDAIITLNGSGDMIQIIDYVILNPGKVIQDLADDIVILF